MFLEAVAIVAALAAIAALLVVAKQAAMLQRLRLLTEQSVAGTRSEAETTRAALSREQGQQRQEIGAHFEGVRAMLENKLREMRDGNEAKLAEIQKTVNEQLHAAVEKQMNESFNRVIDQFTAVQKAMGDVQAVTAQIGDIKRLFSNVKTRGGWGETQVRAMLDDILPPGEYLTNCKVRADSNDAVEFAVRMPAKGTERPLLPIDAKFPVEDYERLLAASDAGDADAERSASRMLERRMRDEAKKIATKYINPPVTEPVPCPAAHDPPGVHYAGAGAEGRPDTRPARRDAHRDAEDGRSLGTPGEAGGSVQQHDRHSAQAHARGGA
jgi:DNA recombination protein RmuC